MNNFVELNEKEMERVEGGCDPVTIGLTVAGLVVAGYALAREVARDAGRAAAYKKLGY